MKQMLELALDTKMQTQPKLGGEQTKTHSFTRSGSRAEGVVNDRQSIFDDHGLVVPTRRESKKKINIHALSIEPNYNETPYI